MHNKTNSLELKKIKILSIILLTSFLLSACSVNFNTGNSKKVEADFGGIFKSTDKGQTWKQKVSIAAVGGAQRNFGNTSINSFTIDPGDNKALYYGSIANGLAYSYDGAETWQLAIGLGATTINDVIVDPKSKCTVYVAISNNIYKTVDCSRNWKKIYTDNENTVFTNALAVDHFDNSRVYVGLSRGDLVQSLDYGESWKTIYRVKDSITKVVIDPKDSRKIYIITSKTGIHRSLDSGANWESLSNSLKEFKLGNNMKDLVIVNTEPAMVFLASATGIVKSSDSGNTWEKINLITPDAKSQINSIAVNEKDPNEIYYVTNTTFFKSTDGGQNWTPQNLPTTRAGWKIIVDQTSPDIIYMGIKSLQK